MTVAVEVTVSAGTVTVIVTGGMIANGLNGITRVTVACGRVTVEARRVSVLAGMVTVVTTPGRVIVDAMRVMVLGEGSLWT